MAKGSTDKYAAGRGEPWAIQPDESEPAYEAFLVYRDQGYSRSYKATSEHLHKARSLIDRWGSKWSWQIRAGAWDAEMARMDAAKRINEQKAARERHIGIAKTVQGKALERLKTIDVNALKPMELIKFLEVAVKMERDALGLHDRLDLQVSRGADHGASSEAIGDMSAEETGLRLAQLTREATARLRERGMLPALPPGNDDDSDIQDAELVEDGQTVGA